MGQTEMAHVGVQRFGTGRAQEDAAEYQEAGNTVAEQIAEAVARIERGKHAGMTHDCRQAEDADGHEPEHHDRAKHPADACGALGLQGE
jgi:hypothetical protein